VAETANLAQRSGLSLRLCGSARDISKQIVHANFPVARYFFTVSLAVLLVAWEPAAPVTNTV